MFLLGGCPSGETPRPRAADEFGVPGKGEPMAVGEPLAEDLSGAPPQVSRSRGHKGGLIVLFPMVFPKTDDPAAHAVAARVQARLAELAKRAGGARGVDVRPDPETVCPPKGGCEATSVSAVIVMKGTTCAVAGLFAGPKGSPAHLLPWSGKIDFANEIVAVGESPESHVKVKDFVPCDALIVKRENEEAGLARYIAGLMPAR